MSDAQEPQSAMAEMMLDWDDSIDRRCERVRAAFHNGTLPDLLAREAKEREKKHGQSNGYRLVAT